MSYEIDKHRRPRRYGDAGRIWQPRDVHKGQRVERIYDSAGRLRGERATSWDSSTSQFDHRAFAAAYPEALALFNGLGPPVVGASLAIAGATLGPWMLMAVALIWALILGLEGLLWCLLLSLAFAFAGAVGVAIGDADGGAIGVGIMAAMIMIATWTSVR